MKISRMPTQDIVVPQPKIQKLQHDDVRSENNSSVFADHHPRLISDKSTTRNDEGINSHGSNRGTLYNNTDLSDPIGWMKISDTTGEFDKCLRGVTTVGEPREEAEACPFTSCRSMSVHFTEPTRFPRVLNAPPRRFYRTFWRAMARKALKRLV